MEGTVFAYCAPQNQKQILLQTLDSYSQELQIYTWESIASERSFDLSCPENPGMSRAALELGSTRNPLLAGTALIHLTSFSNSAGEEGGK